MKQKDARYVDMRKKFLKEYQSILMERARLNKRLRALTKEMDAWDRALIQ